MTTASAVASSDATMLSPVFGALAALATASSLLLFASSSMFFAATAGLCRGRKPRYCCLSCCNNHCRFRSTKCAIAAAWVVVACVVAALAVVSSAAAALAAAAATADASSPSSNASVRITALYQAIGVVVLLEVLVNYELRLCESCFVELGHSIPLPA